MRTEPMRCRRLSITAAATTAFLWIFLPAKQRPSAAASCRGCMGGLAQLDGPISRTPRHGGLLTMIGKPHHSNYCFVFGLQDGQLREVTEYMDTELTAKVLGAPSAGDSMLAVTTPHE